MLADGEVISFDALVLAVADARGLTAAQLLAWTRARNLRLFRSPAYRILMAVVGPAQLLRFAGARWANWHRGTTLEVDGIADDGVRASVRFPRGLFDRTLLEVYAQAFAAALDRVDVPHIGFKYAENSAQMQPVREQAGTFADSIKLWSAP